MPTSFATSRPSIVSRSRRVFARSSTFSLFSEMAFSAFAYASETSFATSASIAREVSSLNAGGIASTEA